MNSPFRLMTFAVAIWSVVLLMGCAAQPPTAQETALIGSAVAPPSQQAAEDAVKRHYEETLFDPESARYTFLPFTRGWAAIFGRRYFGVHICGTINAKNRMGGYVGRRVFWAYFDPSNPNRIAQILSDDGRPPNFAENICRALYGR